MIDAPAELLIFPCNGNAVEAVDCLGPDLRCIGFVDDAVARLPPSRHGIAVFGRRALRDLPSTRVLAVPGSPRSFRERARVIEGLDLGDDRWVTVIHPSAQVSPRARLGRNVLVMAGAVVSSEAVIGSHVCLLPNSVVSHGSTVGDFALVGAGVVVAGGVSIGEGCYIGSGSRLIDGVSIGAGALVGLGSVVIRDVAAGAVVAGCPARRLR